MKKHLLFLTIPFFMLSCRGQENRIPASLAKQHLQLEDFDFNTKFSTILPEDTRSKEYAGYYQVKSEMLEVDTISDGELIGSEKPVRIEYRQRSFSTRDVMANFGSYEFNAVNFATTLDGKIMFINAVVGKTELNEAKSLMETLDKKYGKSTKTKGEFVGKNFDIYTWQLKDRIIRYSLVLDDEENTMKIEVNDQKISNGKKDPHYKGYLFVIKKEYKDKIFDNVSSGDFVFLD